MRVLIETGADRAWDRQRDLRRTPDTDPSDHVVSRQDIAFETLGGVMFGGIGSTVPHAKNALDLPISDQALKNVETLTGVAGAVWAESALTLHGD